MISNILIVDDSDTNRKIIKGILLKNIENASIIEADNGYKALDIINSMTISVVILDIMMPYMDGIEVLEKLKSKEDTKNIPVIMCSAIDESDSIDRALALGALDYFTKPLSEMQMKISLPLKVKNAILYYENRKDLLMKQTMLKAIAEATNELLLNRELFAAISNSLIIVGKAIEVERVFFFKRNQSKVELLFATKKKSNWDTKFFPNKLENPDYQNLPFNQIEEILYPLSKQLPFISIVRDLEPSNIKTILEYNNVKSIIVLPIFFENMLWGFVGFDECEYERIWTEDEVEILTSYANSISGAIIRNDFERRIEYLSYNDPLTGLHNRRFYEEEIKRLDDVLYYPLNIVMVDVNGLKLTNDAFGHKVGDLLLQKVSTILQRECRAGDVVARIGGDEFILLFPNTNVKSAEIIINRIKQAISNEKMNNIVLSISIGSAEKNRNFVNIDEVFKKAEDEMYKNKLTESISMRSKTIDLIMYTLYEKNDREMSHSKKVSEICVAIATKMAFDKAQIDEIASAGLMHDIGKIGIDEKILNKSQNLDNGEWDQIERHPEIGYSILSSVNEFSEISKYVLEHHENWNGAGYPKGLKGNEISVQARIIAVADAFDAMTTDRAYRKVLSEEEAIAEIKRCSGTKFDPEIANVFVEIFMENRLNF